MLRSSLTAKHGWEIHSEKWNVWTNCWSMLPHLKTMPYVPWRTHSHRQRKTQMSCWHCGRNKLIWRIWLWRTGTRHFSDTTVLTNRSHSPSISTIYSPLFHPFIFFLIHSPVTFFPQCCSRSTPPWRTQCLTTTISWSCHQSQRSHRSRFSGQNHGRGSL